MHNSLKFCHFLAIYSTNLICFTNGKGTGKWLYLLRTSVSSAFNKNYSSNAAGCISSISLILFYHIFSHRHSYWKLVLITATLSSIKKPFSFHKLKHSSQDPFLLILASIQLIMTSVYGQSFKLSKLSRLLT